MTKLYLAQSFDERHWVREWELRMERKYGIELTNPFYDTQGRQDVKEHDESGRSRKQYAYTLKPEDIVEGDLQLINEADGVLAISSEKFSIGTSMEIFYAARVLQKPVYVYMKDNKGMAGHPWLQYLCAEVVTSLSAVEAILERL